MQCVPAFRFIQITRVKSYAQAISKARAFQTGLWKVQKGQTEVAEPQFDRPLITRCLNRRIAREHLGRIFCRIGLQPFRVEYEELCQITSDDPHSFGFSRNCVTHSDKD